MMEFMAQFEEDFNKKHNDLFETLPEWITRGYTPAELLEENDRNLYEREYLLWAGLD